MILYVCQVWVDPHSLNRYRLLCLEVTKNFQICCPSEFIMWSSMTDLTSHLPNYNYNYRERKLPVRLWQRVLSGQRALCRAVEKSNQLWCCVCVWFLTSIHPFIQSFIDPFNTCLSLESGVEWISWWWNIWMCIWMDGSVGACMYGQRMDAWTGEELGWVRPI